MTQMIWPACAVMLPIASMVWPHITWPMTVFWPRLCAVDDICGPLTPWNWWCSGQRPSSSPGPLQSLLLLYGTGYQLTFELLRAWFRQLHRNWKLSMPAGASEDFLFCAVEIDSLLLLLLLNFLHVCALSMSHVVVQSKKWNKPLRWCVHQEW